MYASSLLLVILILLQGTTDATQKTLYKRTREEYLTALSRFNGCEQNWEDLAPQPNGDVRVHKQLKDMLEKENSLNEQIASGSGGKVKKLRKEAIPLQIRFMDEIGPYEQRIRTLVSGAIQREFTLFEEDNKALLKAFKAVYLPAERLKVQLEAYNAPVNGRFAQRMSFLSAIREILDRDYKELSRLAKLLDRYNELSRLTQSDIGAHDNLGEFRKIVAKAKSLGKSVVLICVSYQRHAMSIVKEFVEPEES